MWNFEELQKQVNQDVEQVQDAQSLEDFRIKYLGKKGVVAQIYAQFASIPKEDKKVVGKQANDLKRFIEQLMEAKKSSIGSSDSKKDCIDTTIPGRFTDLGHKHLLTQTIEEICDIFKSLGFVIQTSPEVETEFNNFTALNIPVDHPSRDSFDTFYLDTRDMSTEDRYMLLRSHTSPGQIRIMKDHKPPLAIINPGRVYRPDAVDASHSFMFHQIEGLLVDKNVKFSDLKGLLTAFCQRFFGKDVKMRFRPHYFPFTEPSAEVDIQSNIFKGKKDKWLEILGCGMVHPKVFEAAEYPKGKYSGLAFGMGVERIAMLKHGIHDIRIFYENDKRFLNQF